MGETTLDWPRFTGGCNNEAIYGSNQDGDPSCGSGCWYYNTAGMQQAVNVMRQAGYSGPIAIPCIAYANVCADPSSGGTGFGNGNWLTDHSSDPDHHLIAEAHVYGKNTCDTTSCFNTTMLPVLHAGYPMIWGETGESYDYSYCPIQHLIHPNLPQLGRAKRRRNRSLDLGNLGRVQHRIDDQELQRHPRRRLRHLQRQQLPNHLPARSLTGRENERHGGPRGETSERSFSERESLAARA